MNVKRDIWLKGYHDGFNAVKSKHDEYDEYDYISGYIKGKALVEQECKLIHNNQEQEIISEIAFQNARDFFAAIQKELRSSNDIPGLDDPRPDGVFMTLSFFDIDFLIKSYSDTGGNPAALAYCANKVTPHNSEPGLVTVSPNLILSYESYGFNMSCPMCTFYDHPVSVESLVG